MKPRWTLWARSTVLLGACTAAIALTSIVALAVFVILPIEDRSADDEAGLVVLAALFVAGMMALCSAAGRRWYRLQSGEPGRRLLACD